ncbi:S-adenosyl-L-methionine-dependent methyltransferase [Gongronella butleri]|nr:S-adenosyl-L-methionine-dependent methyltransferase [Gongronella butleri]
MALPRLPAIRDLVKLFGLSARSQLGQNFILDKNITDKIVRTAHLTADTPLVVEVGPGPGLLTRSILDTPVPNVVQLAEASQHRVKVIHGDALTIPHDAILHKASLKTPLPPSAPPLHLMGNLPFNVATPLLIQWLHMMPASAGLFGASQKGVIMTLMFQKEVAERIAARVSCSERGRLAVMAQAMCDIEKVYQVPASIFVPKPKVDATVVQMKPKQEKLIDDPETYKTLERLLRYYFTKKRKTIGHTTKCLIKAVPVEQKECVAAVQELIDFQARPGDIDTPTFCNVATHLHQNNIFIP